MVTLHGFSGKLGMAVSMSLPQTTAPFSSVRGAVRPEMGVTLTLAQSKVAFQLGGSVLSSHLM